MAEQAIANTLEAQLERELTKSGGQETFAAKQLRRQIAAANSGQNSRDLYVTGSYKRPAEFTTV